MSDALVYVQKLKIYSSKLINLHRTLSNVLLFFFANYPNVRCTARRITNKKWPRLSLQPSWARQCAPIENSFTISWFLNISEWLSNCCQIFLKKKKRKQQQQLKGIRRKHDLENKEKRITIFRKQTP